MGMTEPAGEKCREVNHLAQNHRVNPWLHQSPPPNALMTTMGQYWQLQEREDGKFSWNSALPSLPKHILSLLGHLLPQLVTQLHHALQAGTTASGLPWVMVVRAQQCPEGAVAGPQTNHRQFLAATPWSTESYLHILFHWSGLLTLAWNPGSFGRH